jgi:hypothetical protein
MVSEEVKSEKEKAITALEVVHGLLEHGFFVGAHAEAVAQSKGFVLGLKKQLEEAL